MGVTRRYVFPALRILVWAVIAVALVRIAFGGAAATSASDTLTATGSITEPTVQVTSGTVTNTVTVSGSVTADPAVTVKATAAGTVSALLAADGATVAAGTPILKIRQETAQDPVTSTDPATGQQTVTQPKPKVTVTTVTSSTAGTLHLPTLKDQTVAVGDAVASVTPGTLSVTGQLSAAQQYRLVDAPSEAQVTLTGGPAPFTCTGLRIGTAAAADTSGTQGTGTTSDTSATSSATGTLTCAVPSGVTAFAGLGASIEIVNGQATGLLVPITAVQGSVQSGNVWVAGADGSSTKKAVTLGLTDGTNVQVTGGLAEGDSVLQFIPVAGGQVNCADPSVAATNQSCNTVTVSGRGN